MIGSGLAVRIARGFTALAAAAIALNPSNAIAQHIRIDAAACDSPVHLVVKDDALSSVLKQLADTLHFEMVYQAHHDPPVNADARMSANELVGALVRDMNFSLEQAVDARCAQGRRLVKLFVLPETDRNNAGVNVSPTPSQAAQTERVAREALSDYLRSHGMDDLPQEAIAVR